MKKTLANAKIAIYYDWLDYQYGGAEKVLQNILSLYPKAELFTLFYDPKKTSWLPKNIKIHTSFLQNFPKTKLLTPIYDIAAESLDFTNFDIVIATTSNVGHCLLTKPDSLFVCYYHNLNRHLYFNQNKFLQPLLNIYKKIDCIYSKRPDYSFCNSQTTQNRLSKYFKINSQIINPGIDTNYFIPSPNPTNDYYLIVSRLVPHKSIDYVINTFNKLNKKLIIVGSGRDQKRLVKLAKSPNIKFTGEVDNPTILKYYQNCIALICPQIEDFGLVSLESQSCGRPVITLNTGGISETVKNFQTGIYYNHQNEKSLLIAINKLSQTKFDHKKIRQHAITFDQSNFMINFKKELEKLWNQSQH